MQQHLPIEPNVVGARTSLSRSPVADLRDEAADPK